MWIDKEKEVGLIYQTADPKCRTTEELGLNAHWYYTLGRASLHIDNSIIQIGYIEWSRGDPTNSHIVKCQGYEETFYNGREAQEALIKYVKTGERTRLNKKNEDSS